MLTGLVLVVACFDVVVVCDERKGLQKVKGGGGGVKEVKRVDGHIMLSSLGLIDRSGK